MFFSCVINDRRNWHSIRIISPWQGASWEDSMHWDQVSCWSLIAWIEHKLMNLPFAVVYTRVMWCGILDPNIPTEEKQAILFEYNKYSPFPSSMSQSLCWHQTTQTVHWTCALVCVDISRTYSRQTALFQEWTVFARCWLRARLWWKWRSQEKESRYKETNLPFRAWLLPLSTLNCSHINGVRLCAVCSMEDNSTKEANLKPPSNNLQ